MSPKHCTACKAQANCLESRQGDLHVRRRYSCLCGKRWTTYEMRRERWQELRQQLREFRDGLEEEQKFHSKVKKLLGSLGGLT